MQTNISKQVAMTSFQPGVFVDTTLGVVLYAEDEGKDSSLKNVFMVDKRNPENASVVFSKMGTFSQKKNDFGILLSQGEIHQTLKDEQHISVGFSEYLLKLFNQNNKVLKRNSIESLPTASLKTLLKKPSQENKTLIHIEINKRTVLSLICIFFAAIGILFGLRLHNRSSRGSGFFVSLIFSTVFWILLFMSESIARKLAHPLIVFLPCIVFLIIIVIIQRLNKLRSIV